MLSCNQVTQLCASEDVRRSSLRTRLAVRLHLMMCRWCRRYVRELAAIGAAARGMARSAPEATGRVDALVDRVLRPRHRPDR